MSIEEKLSHKFIRTLKKRAYGWIAGNEAEGDFGDWEDWRKALVEFERKCRRTRRAVDGATRVDVNRTIISGRYDKTPRN